MDTQPVAVGLLGKDAQVGAVSAVDEEGPLAIVTALGDVIGEMRNDHTSFTGQGASLGSNNPADANING